MDLKKSNMSLSDIIKNTEMPIQIVVNANDLKEVFMAWQCEYLNQTTEKKENILLTTEQVKKELHVSTTTLWRWHNEGMLQKIKISGRVFYNSNDVEAIITKGGTHEYVG